MSGGIVQRSICMCIFLGEGNCNYLAEGGRGGVDTMVEKRRMSV